MISLGRLPVRLNHEEEEKDVIGIDFDHVSNLILEREISSSGEVSLDCMPLKFIYTPIVDNHCMSGSGVCNTGTRFVIQSANCYHDDRENITY